MTTDLFDRLQSALGGAYRIEKELGGGGMSRVFLAEEVELGRRVVVKVLPPEMSAGVNIDRFRREIQLSAQLQHPHIVPLLTAGSDGDLLWYVMPYIAGESLRTRLAREGELPVSESLRILKEVLDALAHAHSGGVVHRDIKPDNVLLSGKHAVVTDFGVAKAVASSTGESGLTSLGVALGTPAYMAPEQASADPHVDHRADIYAVGAMAYEMLTGRPPFTGTTAQAVLSAHITQPPAPVTQHRGTVPPALNELVLRCLAKKAADRPQRADELIPQLDAMLTPSGGMTPTGTQPVPAVDYAETARRTHPVRIAMLFALAAIGVLGLTYGLMQWLNLPTWIFTVAVGLLAVGFPIMLWSGHRERSRAVASMTGVSVATPVGLERHLTLRKALIGGAIAFSGLAAAGAGYGVTRALGIGPAATLTTRGVLTPQDTLILVAEFTDNAGDSSLASAVTAAVRIDFSQSDRFSLVPPQYIGMVLEMMRSDSATVVTGDVAREVAQRLNLKALVTGEVGRLGNAYVLSASLISPTTGETFAAVREAAAGEDDVVGAVDRLAKGLRERIGESLRSIRASEPLGWATTESLAALKAYTRAMQAAAGGESDREMSLLEEAISLDSSFAQAYRRLSVALSNAGRDPVRWRSAATRAYELRDRLNDIERQIVTGYYFQRVDYDASRSIAAYRSVVDEIPLHGSAANNLAVLYLDQHRWKDAEAVIRPLVDSGSTYWTHINALLAAQAAADEPASVDGTLATLAQRAPDDPWLPYFRTQVSSARGDYAAADSALTDLARRAPATGQWGLRQEIVGYHLARVRGHLADAERHARRRMQLSEDINASGVISTALLLATQVYALDGDTARAMAIADSVLTPERREAMDPESWPYLAEVQWHALTGDLANAERTLSDYESNVPAVVQRGQASGRLGTEGTIARAAGRLDDALAAFREANAASRVCSYCWLWELGQVYDQLGMADSAIATYERAVTTPNKNRVYTESLWRAPALRRLGELYEQRGDDERAVEYYNEFVDLWNDADPELQPLVQDVRRRIARLTLERR